MTRPPPSHRCGPSRSRTLVAAALLVALTTVACSTPAGAAPAPLPPAELVTLYAGDAATTLASLPVKGRAPATGYSRDQFGQRWADTDRNGCDTRNDILARDLTNEHLRPGSTCVVISGQLADPYSGQMIEFRRGPDSNAVQIDHVVSLSNAWQTGAQQLAAADRERLANDPLNLLATSGAINQAKGDADAATWLPPSAGYRCRFVARQVAVKARYGLWVTASERDAVARVLNRCPAEPVPMNAY